MGVSLRAGLSVRVQEQQASISIRTLANDAGLSAPLSCRDLLTLLEPVRLSYRLNDATCSGWCEIALSSDGALIYSGHVHNSGALDARYIAITSVPLSVGLGGPVLIEHKGHVGGTFGVDARDEDWRLEARSTLLADNWKAFKDATQLAATQFGTGTGVTELFTSFVGAGTGFWVFGL